VAPSVASKWYHLGIELLDIHTVSSVLDIIKSDHGHDPFTCCVRVLSKWLETDPSATWHKLLEALKEIRMLSLAKHIEEMFLQSEYVYY